MFGAEALYPTEYVTHIVPSVFGCMTSTMRLMLPFAKRWAVSDTCSYPLAMWLAAEGNSVIGSVTAGDAHGEFSTEE